MLPTLQVGPLAIPVAQFSLLLAFWFGLSLAEKQSPRRGIPAEGLYNLIFTGVIAGLLGARVGYVLQYPNAFLQAPMSFFSMNTGMLDSFSGYGIALISMGIYAQRAKFTFWGTLDAVTPLLAVLAVGLALANIASGKSFGAETELPWGIVLWGAKRHPTQFLELAAAALILSLVILRIKTSGSPGKLFLQFTAISAAARLLLEALHGDSNTILNGLRTTQIIAWAALAISLTALDVLQRQTNQKELEHDG